MDAIREQKEAYQPTRIAFSETPILAHTSSAQLAASITQPDGLSNIVALHAASACVQIFGDLDAMENMDYMVQEYDQCSDTAGLENEDQWQNYDSRSKDEADNKSMQTLTSIVCEGTFYCDRRYHSYFPLVIYPFPDDKIQQRIQDIGDMLWQQTFAIYDWEDVPKTQLIHKVLDIGTGTGSWAIDYARRHPKSEVRGIDLSYIQPLWIPPNCVFEIDNLESRWVYVEEYNLIHCRNTLFRNLGEIMRSVSGALKPGGFFVSEQVDYQLRCNDHSWDGTSLQLWVLLLTVGAKKLGLEWGQNAKYLQWMVQQGFENVESVKFFWPTNAWHNDKYHRILGKGFNDFLTSDLEGMSMLILTRAFRWEKDYVRALCALVKDDLNDPRIHAYANVIVTHGSKACK